LLERRQFLERARGKIPLALLLPKLKPTQIDALLLRPVDVLLLRR
jgi:hypothetical protein